MDLFLSILHIPYQFGCVLIAVIIIDFILTFRETNPRWQQIFGTDPEPYIPIRIILSLLVLCSVIYMVLSPFVR